MRHLWRVFEPVAVRSRVLVFLLARLGIWPRPQDFQRMPRSRFEAYVHTIGLDAEIKRALAEHDE